MIIIREYWLFSLFFLINPVAITVTITSSDKFSLITEPKIVLISLPDAALTTSAACSASNKVRLTPPVILIIASVAPVILVSSNGLETACLAASIAYLHPYHTNTNNSTT